MNVLGTVHIKCIPVPTFIICEHYFIVIFYFSGDLPAKTAAAVETTSHFPARTPAPAIIAHAQHTPQQVINFYSPQEPSPIISPWGRERTSTVSLPGGGGGNPAAADSPSSSHRPSRTSLPTLGSQQQCRLAEKLGTNPGINNSRRDVTAADDALARLSNDIRSQHPFITRVHSQTTTCNSNGGGNGGRNGGVEAGRKPAVAILLSPSRLVGPPGQELAMRTHNLPPDGDSKDDNEGRHYSQQQPPEECNGNSSPFTRILTLADSNLSQAESILSSLGCGERRTGLPSDSEEEEDMMAEDVEVSLSSDIESNIRRLERTQAKINAALQTFRSVRRVVCVRFLLRMRAK